MKKRVILFLHLFLLLLMDFLGWIEALRRDLGEVVFRYLLSIKNKLKTGPYSKHSNNQGHPTFRLGEYLFGRCCSDLFEGSVRISVRIAWDIRIQFQWKLEISLAKYHLGLSQQEDSLVPIVFIGTNMSFRVKNKVS